MQVLSGDHKAAMLRSCGEEWEQVIGMLAYRVRVMLSHVRACYDRSKGELDGHALASVFHEMATGQHAPDPRVQRRQTRLGKRPHPFMMFRDTAPDLETATDEPVTVVAKLYKAGSDYLLLYI